MDIGAFGSAAMGEMAPWLKLKYAIAQQGADAGTTNAGANMIRSQAGANLDNANAGQVAPNAAAQRALWGAQTEGLQLDSEKMRALMPMFRASGMVAPPGAVGALGLAPGGYSGGAGMNDTALGRFNPFGNSLMTDAGQTISKAATVPMPTSAPSLTPPAPALTPASPNLVTGSSLLERASPSQARNIRSIAPQAQRLGFAKGTSRVPGKGSGKVDTVKAKLAPGEAVLNKGAAEHVGRETIDMLNAIGMQKMGMPAKGGKVAKGEQHFAAGTSDVQPVGKVKGKTQIAPERAMPGAGQGLLAAVQALGISKLGLV